MSIALRTNLARVRVTTASGETEVGGLTTATLTSDTPFAVTRTFDGPHVADQDGETSLSLGGLLYDHDPGQAALREAAATRTPINVVVEFKSGKTISGRFYVTSRTFEINRDDDWQGVVFDLVCYDESTITETWSA